MRSRPIVALAVTFMLVLVSVSALAQQQASIIGVVTTKAVLPGATVTATNLATGNQGYFNQLNPTNAATTARFGLPSGASVSRQGQLGFRFAW